MKVLKKLLLTLPLAFVLIVAGVAVGCKKKEFRLLMATNVKSQVESVISGLKQDVYNNEDLGKGWQDRKTKFTIQEVNQKLNKTVNYYICLGTLDNPEDVTKISFGNAVFKKGENVSVSIGLNNKIVDKAYYVKDNKLYVASPIVAIETMTNSKIKVNNKEFDLNINHMGANVAVNGVIAENSGVTVTTDQNKYNLAVTNIHTMIGVKLQGLEASDFMVTRKVYDGKLTGYGLTGVDKIGADNTYGYYPLSKSQFDSLTYGKTTNQEINIFVMGKGIAKVNFVVSNATATAEE